MKRTALPPLNSLRAFDQAAHYLSFKQAAQALGLTPSAVSHQIRSLEEALGMPLFRRHTRAIELTPEGEHFWIDVRRAFDLLEESADRVRRRNEDRLLRVSALPFFTSVCLIPGLSEFQRANPDIDLSIETTNRLVDFDREPVDIAIRNLPHAQNGLIARKLIDIFPAPLCAPQLLRGAHPLRQPQDLAHHKLIHVSARPNAWRDWLKGIGLGDLQVSGDLWFDTVPAALQAAAAGHGVTLAMAPLVWAADIARQLAQPFDVNGPSTSAYYLVHRPEDEAKPKIKAFKKWIARDMTRLKACRAPAV